MSVWAHLLSLIGVDAPVDGQSILVGRAGAWGQGHLPAYAPDCLGRAQLRLVTLLAIAGRDPKKKAEPNPEFDGRIMFQIKEFN